MFFCMILNLTLTFPADSTLVTRIKLKRDERKPSLPSPPEIVFLNFL